MSKILLGETLKGAKVELDLQRLITERTLLCSITRYGKSWTARRIIEQVFGKAGIVVIDVEGEYATLRDKYPLLIIGQDVQIVPESAEFLADQVLEHDLSVIIDGSNPELDIAAFQEFIARFIDRFIAIETHAQKPYLWILEEADELAPEKGTVQSLCQNQVRKLVKKGGKRGIGAIVLTQRPAFVSKFVISQCSNKLIGRTEWPDDLEVLRKFARIPRELADPESKDRHAIKNLDKGQFYVSGPFIHEYEGAGELVKVGPVTTKHLGATPELVPPAPKELKNFLTQLHTKLPGIIEEQIKPAVPKVAEIERRLKDKLEKQWQVRVERKDRELKTIESKTEAKYETKIADLERKYEEAVRHSAIKGGVSDLLSHPMIKKNLEKLNDKQRGYVQLLEEKGPQDSEHSSLYLEIKPKDVPAFVYAINRKIPKLIESVSGRYVSRLAKLFPVTEEAKAEAKEIDKLRAELNGANETIETLKSGAEGLRTEIARLKGENEQLITDRNTLLRENAKIKARRWELENPTKEGPVTAPTGEEKVVEVEATLHRKLTSFDVVVNKETLIADEGNIEGKILARALDGFFDEPKSYGQVMSELERRYGMSKTPGGNRTTVNTKLTLFVSMGIFDREQDGGQWVYQITPEFKDRVRKS